MARSGPLGRETGGPTWRKREGALEGVPAPAIPSLPNPPVDNSTPTDGVDGPNGIDVPHCGSLKPATGEPPTMSITMIGLDTAKSVFQIHGVNETGKAELKRKVRRSELLAFFEKQERCTVVMEACGAAHHWARILTGLGHTVKLLAAEAIKPFVKKGKKNDAADAAAICEAASRPDTQFVPAKTVEQQGILALHTARSLLVKQQTMLANAIRGLATEFGLVVPKGLHNLEPLVELIDADEAMPARISHKTKTRRVANAKIHSYS